MYAYPTELLVLQSNQCLSPGVCSVHAAAYAAPWLVRWSHWLSVIKSDRMDWDVWLLV